MRTITCKECGYAIGEDDFSLMQCPVCDSFMELNRLQKRIEPDLEKVIRIDATKRLPERQTNG
ncbi:hypothetical protein Fifi44_00051 [Erwinia phage Fifi44]|uniref:Uncharacterized protein n=1 Tax=Erwinia phage Fifi44 TaxID=2876597 RepID=A0AAE8Y650_9CAUD|nr:hypothetical protein QNG95_gp51 [Erwinia phage Fifi44]QQV88353.1 hypothetical protein pEaSNUABM27_00051 [Erwinia phage pEa_SNUABM_27]UCR74920.1 hypothetical protein Fifi44_00051 [Erwinia phage Fifi44]UCR80847.1 hypothetical protein Fifi451_00027 [Erwinia phage Fifi451]WJN63685.1 hydrogenase maturation factor [Erwinia phage Aioli]